MRKTIPPETWQQIRTAYASGIGLREIARNMGIAAGTVLARAKREGWTRQIRAARAIVPAQSNPPGTSTADAAALIMRQRGERHVGRVAGLTERILATLEGLGPEDQLQYVDEFEKTDRIGRRTYGLDEPGGSGEPHIRLRVVASGGSGGGQVAAEFEVGGD